MSKSKQVINDPVFGFITIPNEFVETIIKHPYVQRLNRIKQLGMASFAYPGAQHTRFHHTLGAMHLMQQVIMSLRAKGNEITEEEMNGALACILLHDVGHGPFSHVLEHTIVEGIHHEEISLKLMQRINEQLNGQLDICIAIFRNEYPKTFLHELVSGQVDVDRLDYLRRDCFFTGVNEGNIGSERIIQILDVRDNKLVIEAKGIFSIENFLLSRRLMYWQVYHHKTAIAAETTLINALRRAKELVNKGIDLFASPSLKYFLKNNIGKDNFNGDAIDRFISLDDSDIWCSLKEWTNSDDMILSTLSNSFVNRGLFKIEMHNEPVSESYIKNYMQKYIVKWNLTEEDSKYFVASRTISTDVYNENGNSIDILFNDEHIENISTVSDLLNVQLLSKKAEKYYFAYLKI
ncbi:HD domain-containing protein [Dysgonomonas macrotermitis]|uniref:HD/PDEase domain-containing protein n=1 Tax=Dysgonomonas macrotermitis TaxID=1346286 RepID=A0A1M5BAW8_9BACT|nr:HD domain-containing protein [Dysgonomonas macrotermitis]SHF39649.1 hypothetical protein SAMN05444362_1067 [Dysgonomonas macrotermitis]